MAKYLKPQTPLQHQSGDYIYPITTIDQVLMDNGERLNANIINIQLDGAPEDNINFGINADTLGGQKPEYYATAEDLVALNDSKLSMELLWENASPTSAFARTTVTVPNYEKYKLFLLLTSQSSMFFAMNGGYMSVSTATVWNEGENFDISARLVVPNTDGTILFTDGRSGLSTGKSLTTNNVQIPLKIYGIKGVS